MVPSSPKFPASKTSNSPRQMVGQIKTRDGSLPKQSSIVFIANSQSCVLLHPKTNNPLQNKISSIATKLSKHEKDMKK